MRKVGACNDEVLRDFTLGSRVGRGLKLLRGGALELWGQVPPPSQRLRGLEQLQLS